MLKILALDSAVFRNGIKMKTIHEWQINQTSYKDQETFIENVNELAQSLNRVLKSYEGDRFDGFFDIIGISNDFERAIADVRHGTVQKRNEWSNKLQQWKIEQFEKLPESPQLKEWAGEIKKIVEQFREEQIRYTGEKFPGYDEISEGMNQMTLIMNKMGL